MLEAIYVVATGKSFRTPSLADCARHGAAGFVARAEVERDGAWELAVALHAGEKRREVQGKSAPLSEHLTHLPVVASQASTHLRVEKRTVRGRTLAAIDLLDREGRIGELARMLAGEVDSRIAREHAEALMEAASSTKEDG